MRFKIRNIFIGLGIYLCILVWTLSLSEAFLVIIFIIYVVACMFIEKSFINLAKVNKKQNFIEFVQSGAVDSLGVQYSSFHYIFYSNEFLSEVYHHTLSNALKTKLGFPDLSNIIFKDIDKNLKNPETRKFWSTTIDEPIYKTQYTLLCDFRTISNMHGIRWWILVNGAIDPNKVFWRYMLAPLLAPFSLFHYFCRQYNPLIGLMTIYPNFFNSIDILNRTREVQFVAFETLVEVLEHFGIDTTELKQQKSNILNINVSGGQTNFGSIVQGAKNTVNSVTGGRI